MADAPTFEQQPASRAQWVFFNLIVAFLFVFFFNPLVAAVSFGLYLLGRRYAWLKWAWRILSFFNLIGLLFFDHNPLLFKYSKDLLPLILVKSLLFTPLAVVTIEIWRAVSMFLKGKSLSELVEEQQGELLERERRASMNAQAQEARLSQSSSDLLTLGVYMGGDNFPRELGIFHKHNAVHMAEEVLDQHVFVLGTTGAGKSETLKRLIYEVLTKTDRDVIVVDGKGEEKLANELQRLCQQNGRGQAPIFKMGQGSQGDAYNGFIGQPMDIYNRLAALVGVQEAEGNATFYADMSRNILQLVCFAPEKGAPKNFTEAIRRIGKAWLVEAWQDDQDEQENIEEIKDEHITALKNRMLAVARPLKSQVSDEGFILEESRSAIFSIRTQSVSDTAKGFLYFLIEDIKDYVGKRQQRPGLLVIDEFGMFGNANIVDLLSLARSSQLGVVLATQSLASLGDEATREMILTNTNTTFLMLTKFPEDVSKTAGTTYQVESSFQHDEGETTGMGSARIQHIFKVDPDKIRRLQPGETALIRNGYVTNLRVARVME